LPGTYNIQYPNSQPESIHIIPDLKKYDWKKPQRLTQVKRRHLM
jgi:hypothetical protein